MSSPPPENQSPRRTFLAPHATVNGLIEVVLLLAAICTVTGWFDRWHWILDLTVHFRVQYTILLLAGTIWLAIRHRPGRALLIFGLALLNLLIITPYAPTIRPDRQSEGIRLMLANVNAANHNTVSLLHTLAQYNPDIIVIEELTPHWTSLLTNLNTYAHHIYETRNDCFGIGLFSRIPLQDPTIITIGRAEVPSIKATITTHLGTFTLIATHPLPPSGPDYSASRDLQLKSIPGILAPIREPVILVGDLNVTPWSSAFRQLLRSTGLHDSMRNRGIQPSWPAGCFPLRIPIDHVLHAPSIRILDRQVGPDIGSDHFPIIVDFVPPPDL